MKARIEGAGRDETFVKEILAIPTSQEGWNDAEVENVLEYNLKSPDQ